MIIPQTIFWLAAVLLGYTYIGYPLLLWFKVRTVEGSKPNENFQASVSILVIVHNEESCICKKIENLLSLHYPVRLREIVIASDASTDATVSLARSYSREGVTVKEFRQHRGKPAVLNEVIPGLSGNIVVLMDVRQQIDANALQILVANFSDARVGAVSGELVLSSENGGVDGVGFYWRYEKMIRQNESLLDSSVGVSGAFYAIRRYLFKAIPEQTILDDVLIPMQVVRQGYRVLFEPAAHAHDKLSASPKIEFIRKVRTIAGNFQLLCSHLWLLNPIANRLWLQFFSHKICRLLCPLALLVILVMNLLLLEIIFYQISLTLQLLFYAAAATGFMLPDSAKKHSLLSIPQAFCLLNWCAVAGFYRFVRGQQKVTWTQTGTPVESPRAPR